MVNLRMKVWLPGAVYDAIPLVWLFLAGTGLLLGAFSESWSAFLVAVVALWRGLQSTHLRGDL